MGRNPDVDEWMAGQPDGLRPALELTRELADIEAVTRSWCEWKDRE